MYYDDKVVIMRAQTQKRNPEDEAYCKLVVSQLEYVVEDFKNVMNYYNTFGDSSRINSNKIIFKLIPTMIFLKSPYCESCCEFLNLGDKTTSYDLFGKLNRLYNTKNFDFNLKRYYGTKYAMSDNLHATIRSFDAGLYQFCRKINISSSTLASMMYTYKEKEMEKNVRKPSKEMSDEVYIRSLKELKYLFTEMGLGFMFTPEEWGVL